MEEDKIKTPRNAMALYIKLYCKKRGLTNKTKKPSTEAIKSWLSLSESEKSEFINKYNECNSIFQHRVATQLKHAKPYMKKKKALQPIKESSDEFNHLENITHAMLNSEEDNIPLQISSTRNNIGCDQDSNDEINLFNNSKFTEITKIDETEIVMPEPTPPVLLTGEELFLLINKSRDNDKTWAELPPTQKKQFQKAVLTIKRTYINQYKAYLESLPSLRLIEHYKNVKNDIS